LTPSLRRPVDAIVRPERLYRANEILIRPSPVPKSAGVYAWYFDELPPGVPVEGCHQALGHTLLYVGIAPRKPHALNLKPSERTLRHRMRDHFGGNAEGSTLRLTLGCLLSDTLGIRLRRVGSGIRRTFTNPGEIILDKWMAEHARVAWVPIEQPWRVETELLSTMSLPLNLQGNTHAFVSTLKNVRRAAKNAAMTMDVTVDNGGTRRVKSK